MQENNAYNDSGGYIPLYPPLSLFQVLQPPLFAIFMKSDGNMPVFFLNSAAKRLALL